MNVVDVNVWLALVSKTHRDHELTDRWFEGLDAGTAGMSRMVQLGVVRLLGVRAIVGPEAMPAAQAWFRLEELVEDERVEMLIEPPGLYEVLPSLFRYRQPTPNLINDAYLAAFAIAGGYGLVTHDRGFAEFRGLDVEILSV